MKHASVDRQCVGPDREVVIMGLRGRNSIQITVAAIIILAMSGCMPSADTPKKNPKPDQFMHISGTAVQFARLQIIAEYATSNPACEYEPNSFENHGAMAPQTFMLEIPVHQAGGSYDAVVPLDELQAGHCQWKPFEILTYVGELREPPIQFKTYSDLHNYGAVALAYFPNHVFDQSPANLMPGIWLDGTRPPTFRLICVQGHTSDGRPIIYWYDRPMGADPDRFLVSQERSITINLVEQAALSPR